MYLIFCRFINGVEIEIHEKGSKMVVTSSIPGLKIVEKYEWGVPTTLPRRDMRKGKLLGGMRRQDCRTLDF